MHGSPTQIRFSLGLLVLILVFSAPKFLHAQDNYEIQVYPSETIAPKTLLTELHSNYTVEGSTTTQYGMLPTQGQEHETIELTQGITTGLRSGFTSLLQRGMAMACSGWAITFVHGCAPR